MRESWFVSDGISDADRSRAMVLSLSGDQREVKELRLRTLDLVEAAPPRAPAPGAADDEPDAPALEPAPRSGPPPVIQLPFDRGYDDEGPHRLKGKPEGNEIRLAAGRSGRALFIGGTEDWLDYPLPAPLQFPRGFSLELWLKREDWENPYRGGSGWQTVASLATGASLSITAPGCPLHKPWALEGFVSRHSGGREHARAHSKGWSVPAGRWVHAALVYDPAERALIVYLDGREADRALGAPEPELNIRQIRLGTWYKANQAYRGLIDEVEIYDYPRSAADIAAAAGR